VPIRSLRCFEFVSAIVAHRTSDKNVALAYHTTGRALIPRMLNRLAEEVT
jgi:hypothetical protein